MIVSLIETFVHYTHRPGCLTLSNLDSSDRMTNLIHLAIPAFLALLILEAILAARMRLDLYEWKDSAASLTMGIGSVLIALVAKAIQFSIFTALYKLAPFKLGFAWWVWPVAFFADEISYYVFHRT